MGTDVADLADPVVAEALLRARLAMRTALGEEDFLVSPYWLDDEPHVTCEWPMIVFHWPGRSLSYRVGAGEVIEMIEAAGPWLSCRTISWRGEILHSWRHGLGDPAHN